MVPFTITLLLPLLPSVMRLKSTCWKASLYLQHKDVTGIAAGYHSSPSFLQIPLKGPGSQEQEKWQQQLLHLSSELQAQVPGKRRRRSKGPREEPIPSSVRQTAWWRDKNSGQHSDCLPLSNRQLQTLCCHFCLPCSPVLTNIVLTELCYNWQVVGMGLFYHSLHLFLVSLSLSLLLSSSFLPMWIFPPLSLPHWSPKKWWGLSAQKMKSPVLTHFCLDTGTSPWAKAQSHASMCHLFFFHRTRARCLGRDCGL